MYENVTPRNETGRQSSYCSVCRYMGLEELIEKERKSGVFLSVLGYGMGNYKDSKMQILASV